MDNFSLKNLPEFDNHRSVMLLEDEKIGLTAFIALHRGGLQYPTFGATRLWHYESKTDALRDALRLSKMMSYKSALAGLPYGGAKAVLMDHKTFDVKKRRAVLMEYAERLNYFHGHFITGTDVGLQASDLKFMKKRTAFLVGLHIDPTFYTAMGLMSGLEASLKEVFGKIDLSGKSFALEGMGKIGKEFLKNIYGKAGKIYVTDLQKDNLALAKKIFPNIEIVEAKKFPYLKVDVYAPCGTHGSLNSVTVSAFRCKIILGGANNQLENSDIGEKLYRAGILYTPDYVVNAGGLMSVVHEFESGMENLEKLEAKVKKIKKTLQGIFSESKKRHRPPCVVADEMARKILEKTV